MSPSNRKPTHPGIILLEHFLKPMGISQTQFAKLLGSNWTSSMIDEIIEGKRRVTAQAALDFANALGTTPQFWSNLQNHYSTAGRIISSATES